jgi:hypothetical protein
MAKILSARFMMREVYPRTLPLCNEDLRLLRLPVNFHPDCCAARSQISV